MDQWLDQHSDWETNYKIWCTILTFGNYELTFQ